MVYKEKLIWLPILAFLISFAATYPSVSVLIDETHYLRQAAAFSNGLIEIETVDPITNESEYILPSTYPPGTSLLASFFMLFGDWTTAFWMPALSLCFMFIFTFLLLNQNHLNPWFSLLILFFPPVIVMARVVSSDVISGVIVVFAWLLFWKGHHSKTKKYIYWFATGFIAGISILFRETNVLFFIPLFLGTIFRRDRNWIWIFWGGVLGTLLRPLLSYIIFSDPFFIRDPEYGFSFAAMFSNAVIYIPLLTLVIPGGLIFALLYKGDRKIEVISTIILVLLFFLSYEFIGQKSGFLKSLVLGPRFFIPLLPIIAFSCAESIPRIFKNLSSLEKYKSYLKFLIPIILTIGTITINIGFYSWTNIHKKIQNTILEKVPQNTTVIYNQRATKKYVSELQGYNSTVHFENLNEKNMNHINDGFIVFVQRNDSNFWIEYAHKEASFIGNMQTEEIYNKNLSKNYRLLVFKIKK